VRLNCLLAQEQLGRDLRIGLAVYDKPSELELTFGQRFKANPIGCARSRAPVDPVAEPAQLTFRLIPVAECPAALERSGGVLQLGCGAVTLVGLGKREDADLGGELRLWFTIDGVRRGSVDVQQIAAPSGVSQRTVSASYLSAGADALKRGLHTVLVYGRADGQFLHLSLVRDLPLVWVD
jgi:hypothetical protein